MSSPADGASRLDFIPDPSTEGALTYERRRMKVALVALVILAAIVLAAVFGRYVWAPAVTHPPGAAARSPQDGAAEHQRVARLPEGVVPVLYRLHLWPVLDVLDGAPADATNFTFQGRLALTLRVAAEGGAEAIVLHAAADSLTLRDEDVTVAEASDRAADLGDAWDTFPYGEFPYGEAADRGHDIKRVPLKPISRDSARDRLELRPAKLLAHNATYIVFLKFNGTLSDNLSGFYRSSFEDQANKAKRWLAVTHMQPTSARSVFPCMDEPGFRAPFRVSIAARYPTQAIANAPLDTNATIIAAPLWNWYHFKESVAMPTYLVAFAVTDFNYITPTQSQPRRQRSPRDSASSDAPSLNATSMTADALTAAPREIEVRLWARPSVLGRGQYAVKIAPKLLKYYTDYFGVQQPLSKIDLLAVPDFEFGAMENWGLVVFRESHLLVNRSTEGVRLLEQVAETVAHELAHQWLGNLVTPAWWDELWLSEGFTEYIHFQAVDHVEPDWHVGKRFQARDMEPAMQADASMASRAVAARLRSKHEITQAFDTIVYSKGACIVRMLRHCLGEKVFKQGVQAYMGRWRHNSTTESRLWESLTEAVTQDRAVALPKNYTVAQVMSAWTKTTGFPVVNVTRDAGKLVFSQERFLGRAWQRNSSRPFSGPELWCVPLSLATRANATMNRTVLQDTRPSAWLVDRTLELEYVGSAEDWVLANVQKTGYFRVNYDLDNWRLLTEQLQTDPPTLPDEVRAQLLSDAFALASAGLLPYGVPLNMTVHLRKDKSPQPWAAALDALRGIGELLTGHPAKNEFERYMQWLLRPTWKRLKPADAGTAPPTGEIHAKQLHRAAIVDEACKVHLSECEDWANRAVHYWRAYENYKTVPAMLRSTAYCSAVATGTSDVWDFMWEQYGKVDASSDGIEQASNILSALTCSGNPAKITWLLALSLGNTSIKQQDLGDVWDSAALQPVARLLVYPYVREHWPRIHAKFNGSSMVRVTVLSAAMRSLSSEDALADFRARYNDTLSVASWSIDSSVEELRTAVEWRQKNLAAVRDWVNAALLRHQQFG